MFTNEPARTMVRTRIPKKAILREAIRCPDAVNAELCRRSLYFFLQEFWSEVVSETEFHPNWHIELLAKELEQIASDVANKVSSPYDLIVNVPPGTTKTILFSIMFPVWCWINWYWMRFITTAYSAALSLESAEYSRDLVRSKKFQMYFPELSIKQDKDTKTNFRIIKKRGFTSFLGGNRFSTSIGGTLIGFHSHISIVDDPLNPNQAASEQEIKNANSWMDNTLPTRKTSKKVSRIIVVQQRLAQNDPSGHWLAKTGKRIKHLSLPGEIRNYRKYLKPVEWSKYYEDDLLDPVRMPWSVLRDLEIDLGQYGYAGQIGQNPTPPGGGMFKVAFISIMDQLPSPVNFVQTVRYWDKAASADSGCYTVGVKMSVLRNGRYLIHDVVRGQWATDAREMKIKSTAHADGSAVRIYMEQEPGSAGKDSVLASRKMLDGFAAYGDRPTGDKIHRADAFSVQVNLGQVMLLRGDWNQAYIDELQNFPFGTFKDQVDASSGAYKQLSGKKQAGPVL